MRNDISFTEECQVYPGKYIPKPGIKALLQELEMHRPDPVPIPRVNLDEHKNCFVLKVAIPGVKKEDILIDMNNNSLTVLVLGKNRNIPGGKGSFFQEFDSEFMEGHLLLPLNADTEFVSAEYSDGVLCLHIPKTELPVKSDSKQIIVY